MKGKSTTCPSSILFVCTANRARSVMAEAVMARYLASHNLNLNVLSAGTRAISGSPPTEDTLRILERHGHENIRHAARVCTDEILASVDAVFVMEERHRLELTGRFPERKDDIFRLADFCPDIEPWIREMGIPDPFGMADFFHTHVYSLVESSCLGLLDRLAVQAQGTRPALILP